MFFGSKSNLRQKSFVSKIYFGSKNISDQTIHFGSKPILDQHQFWIKTNFGSKPIFDQTNFGSKPIMDKNQFWINFESKIYFGLKINFLNQKLILESAK